MKHTSVPFLAFILIGVAPVSTPWPSNAAVLQAFDQLFLGDDASESFEFSLSYDPVVPSTLRLAGFLENRNWDSAGAVRLFLGWQTTNGSMIENIIFPAWPDYLQGVRLPAADLVSGPVRVPIEFEAKMDFSPAWVKLSVEGLTGSDNFRLVGNLTIQPELRLRISHIDSTAVQLAWPTNFVGQHLEYATTLSASIWTTVTNTVSVAGRDFLVKVETTDAIRVYRLRKP